MKSTQDKSVRVLNHLVEICKDGQEGFRTAADDADDPQLSSIFSKYAAQRAAFAADLQNRIRGLGGSPEKSSSVAGAMHRGWINLKAAVASHETHAVLEECERGEDTALNAYRQALEKDLIDPITRDLVSRQFVDMKAAHDRVKELRDSPTYTKK